MQAYEGKRVRGPNGEMGIVRNGQIVPVDAPVIRAGIPEMIAGPRPEKPEKPNLPTGYQMGSNGLAELIPGLPAPKGSKAGGDDDNIDDEMKLRKEFKSLPAVQSFETVAPLAASAFQAGPGGAGDLNIIYALGKTMDPNSVVREGELQMAGNTGSLGEKLMGYAKQISQGGNLTPEVRRGLLNELRNRGSVLADSYNQARKQYEGLAGQYGLAPDRIVGGHAALPFQQAEANFLGRPIRNLDGSVGAAPRGQEPKGPIDPTGAGDIGFNQPDATTNFRMTPDQEAMFGQYLQRNANKLTPEGMAVAYEAITGQGLNPDKSKEVIAYIQKGGDPAKIGVDYSKTDEARENEVRARKDALDNTTLLGPDGSAKTLLTSGATLNLSDEAAGVGSAIVGAVTGRNPIEEYRMGRDVERMRISDARKDLGWGGTAFEIGGGFLSANPTSALAPLTGTRQLVQQGARTGAYGGALAGFGSGEGFADSAGKTILGGGIGAALGGGISALSARGGARGLNPELADAAARRDVPLNRAMVDPRQTNKLGVLEASAGGGQRVRDGLTATTNAIEREAGAISSGATGTPESAGAIVQQAANRFITRSKGIKDRLYTRAETLAGNAQVSPAKALAQIDQEIAALSATPKTNKGEIDLLQELREDMANPLSVEAIRGLRTSLRGKISEKNLTMTQAEARVARVMDAATQDIVGSVSPDAARAYTRADTFYRERQTQIKDVLQKFLGKRDAPLAGEKAFNQIKSMASPNGDGRRLAVMMRNLEPDEQADVAATLASQLGRDAPSEPFSAAKFITHAKALSPSARRTIFGPQGAQAVDDLMALSRAARDSGSLRNFSRSGVVPPWKTILTGMFLGGTGTLQGGAATGAAALAGTAAVATGAAGISNLSARALMSPALARWAAQASNATTPSAIQTSIRRLSGVASRDPAIAGELGPLQRMLESQFRPALASNEADNQNQRNQ